MIDIKFTIENVFQEIIGESDSKLNIIKINSQNLCEGGDICFPTNLLAWRKFIGHEDIGIINRNILEHYLKRHNVDTAGYSNKDVEERAFNLLISASKSWALPVEKASIQKEKVCLFFNRSSILAAAIKLAIKKNRSYGQQLQTEKSICLTINEDSESNLTTARLHQIKKASEHILILHGYNTKKDDPDYKYCMTTKSQGNMNDEGCQKYVCGVVKNPETNTKETALTCEMYLQRKINELAVINEGRLPESVDEQEWLKTIAEAVVTFEFLSVKPSQSSFVKTIDDPEERVTNNKGGAFVLYNAARITAILKKFEYEQLSGNYPELWDIDRVDFDKLVLEDEWSLVYNFILGYPEVILKSVQYDARHEFCTHMLCSFLFNLCQRFSIYYRRCRILTQRRDTLIPTMMARLYLLEALKIVVHNSLAIFNIVPISRMELYLPGAVIKFALKKVVQKRCMKSRNINVSAYFPIHNNEVDVNLNIEFFIIRNTNIILSD